MNRLNFFSLILILATTIIGGQFTSNAQSATRIYHDAEAYGLKGHVKSVTTKEHYNDKIQQFSPDGAIIVSDEYKITRDKKGRLTDLIIDTTYLDSTFVDGKFVPDPYDYYEWVSFVWDKKQVVEITCGQHSLYQVSLGAGGGSAGLYFKYNRKGEVSTMTFQYKAAEPEIYTYSNYKYDDHSNWIERKVNLKYNETNETYIETRSITYYE